eukprot:12418236-Karenia_brevis.AAC.1
MLMTKILKSTRSKLRAENLVSSFPDQAVDLAAIVFGLKNLDDRVGVDDVSFVDDVVWPIVGGPEEIEAKTKRVLTIISQEFVRHGLRPNYKSGKTEVVLQYAGKGCQKTHRHITHTCNNKIVFEGPGSS